MGMDHPMKFSDTWPISKMLNLKYITNLLNDIQSNLYNKASERKKRMTYHAKTLEEINKIMNTQPGFIYAPWCGNVNCEEKMKEIKGRY